jgi:tetratricopeptide (TPR) repeat protein
LIYFLKKINYLNQLECWEYEPNDRPNIQKVVLTLKAIISSEQDDTINKNFSEENDRDNSSEIYQSFSKSSDVSYVIPDINENLSIGSNINLSSDDNAQNLKFVQSNILESKSNLTGLSNTSIKATGSSIKLEEDEFTISDKKAITLIKKLDETKSLYTLKLLFEDLKNEFSSQVLIDSLVALADPTPFNLYFTRETITKLELHLRTWIAVLERVCFSPIRLTNELRDKIYNSLTRFTEIHQETIHNIIKGPGYNFQFNFNQKDDKNEKVRNYNIDFLLIHLRDTLNSLRDDETWPQEIIRKTKELLKIVLNIVPGILSTTPGATIQNETCSILSMLTQLRQGLSFKYPVASYYIDWRIILIIQHNLLNWSKSSEKIINNKFGEMILMEYLWSYMERELINVSDKSILNSQTKFDELSNKLIKLFKNADSQSLTLPHTLWFGILDLAQNLVLKSIYTATHGLGYYIAIESLNKAPSSFIQFKAIEVLLSLYNINNKLFSMVEIDFDQHVKILNENKLATDNFQHLLTFIKETCLKDFNISNNAEVIGGKEKGKEKGVDQNSCLNDHISNHNILDAIADEMTCPISSEPTDRLCILKCQHILSLNNFKKLKQKNCPKCREKVEDNDIRYISQHTIYKNLYSHLFKAGYILPSIELVEDSNNQYNDESDSSAEADLILSKKKKSIKVTKLNSNISLQSIFFSRILKRQHPIYQNIIKELNEKNYKEAEYYCKEFLKTFPTNYSAIKCILAYIYRCLNDYEQAHLYLNEVIDLKDKNPIAYFIRGEIFFKQKEYKKAIKDLVDFKNYNVKTNNLCIILGNSYLLEAVTCNNFNYLSDALKCYVIALHSNPNSYLCLKNCAYIYERQKDYSNTLKILGKLLSINKEDSLILCYYGEILTKVKKYSDAISYFTEANTIDPENVHNLNKRAIAYFILRKYDKSLLDLNKTLQLNPLNSIAHYYKALVYITELNCISYDNRESIYYLIKTMENAANIMSDFGKCIELDLDFWSHIYKTYKMEIISFNCWGIINKFSKYMYRGKFIINFFVGN